ncbi:hypothetical protein D4R99_04855 [bacterium]|nr:MAG: hypothetical protein D4R99_04855 [bacterium]
MDFKKDTKEDFYGQPEYKNQGQFITPKNTTVAVLKDISDFDETNHEISHSFLCKKAEKLATALYLVTGFLSDNEPIKWGIREGGIAILTDLSSFNTETLSNRQQCIKKIMSDIERITSLLEIAAVARFVSEMNIAILKEEYLSLGQSLGTNKKNGLEESFVFGREFFSTRGTTHSSVSGEKKPESFYKGQVKDSLSDNPLSFQQKTERSPVFYENVLSDNSEKKQNRPLEMGITDLSKNTLERGTRRELILSLVREKGELSIKDITAHFSDCGEKTIQRELAALVVNNVLKKTGDRRWSRYSLFLP